jgi:UDP-N-acetylglucosamine 2-epimerase (non-hydrolysing)
MRRRGIPHILVHTGQHYDERMSRVFFDQLGLPPADICLRVGSDTHARQTARIMTEFEAVCCARRPDLVVVAGDVNSTVAAALVAAKLCIPVAHVEAGLRSFDRGMPEEVNRVVTDHLSEYLFTTEVSANINLRREGLSPERIYFTGNCMVDSLKKHLELAVQCRPEAELGLTPKTYAIVTLHRPSNVDDPDSLHRLLDTLGELPLPVLFPVHPRTQARLNNAGVHVGGSLRTCEPLPYLAFLGIMAQARLVLTDSGGIQEETTALRVPCITLRNNTERPVTIAEGTNCLVGTDPLRIRRAVEAVLRGDWPAGSEPPLWDGHAAVRVVDTLEAAGRRQGRLRNAEAVASEESIAALARSAAA